MSTLRVNNITDTSGGSSSLSVPGAAKAWVNFNGTGTVAIRGQMNVSSITDFGTGTYGVNFANALTDANYCVSFTPLSSLSDMGERGSGSLRSSTRSTTEVRLGATNYSDTVFADMLDISVAIFR